MCSSLGLFARRLPASDDAPDALILPNNFQIRKLIGIIRSAGAPADAETVRLSDRGSDDGYQQRSSAAGQEVERQDALAEPARLVGDRGHAWLGEAAH